MMALCKSRNQSLIDAYRNEYLVIRDSWQAEEREWRNDCDMRGIPSTVVFIRRGTVYLYIDPPRPMKEAAVDILWPRFLVIAKRYRVQFCCGPSFCSITAPRKALQDILALALNTSVLVKNMDNICPPYPKRERCRP